jgi:hypothetical protein
MNLTNSKNRGDSDGFEEEEDSQVSGKKSNNLVY